jgi:hypothetical protein
VSAPDFSQHNQHQAAVWRGFHAGRPTRVPMTISCNPRMILLDPVLNAKGYTFQQVFTDPAVMFEVHLDFAHWFRHAVPADIERGLPDKWTISPSFQNTFDAGWFGAPFYFAHGEVPDTRPILDDDNKRMLFDQGPPGPFDNLMQRALHFLDYFRERAPRVTFHGRPVEADIYNQPCGTDGPFTLACSLRGATNFCLDLRADPDYAHQLLAFLTDALIARQRAWRERCRLPARADAVFLADDSIALLSPDSYREFVLPHHHRLVSHNRLPGAPLEVHLCGDATHHFVTIRDQLGATAFDTGFPVDHAKLRRDLGPDIIIYGGPHVDLLLHGTPQQVAAETRRILRSGVMEGGKFVLKEANNLAPRTPLPNLQAMYDTCQREGRYT